MIFILKLALFITGVILILLSTLVLWTLKNRFEEQPFIAEIKYWLIWAALAYEAFHFLRRHK